MGNGGERKKDEFRTGTVNILIDDTDRGVSRLCQYHYAKINMENGVCHTKRLWYYDILEPDKLKIVRKKMISKI